MAPRSFTLWPGGLVGRVILVLLAAVALEFAGSTLLYEQTAALLPSIASLDDLAHRLLRVERGMSAPPPDTEVGKPNTAPTPESLAMTYGRSVRVLDVMG